MNNFSKYWWRNLYAEAVEEIKDNKVKEILNKYQTCVISTPNLSMPDVNEKVRALIYDTVKEYRDEPIETWHATEIDHVNINMNISEWEDSGSVVIKNLIYAKLLIIIGLGYETIKTTNIVRYLLQMRRPAQKNILIIEIPNEEFWKRYGLNIQKEQIVWM